jgi:hypothetical protein
MANFDLTISTGSNYSKKFQIMKSDGTVFNLTGCSAVIQIIQTPGMFSSVAFSIASGHLISGNATGILTLSLTPADVATINGNFYKLEVTDSLGVQTEILTGSIILLDETRIGIEYLTPMLRLKMGDTNPASYRYADDWMKTALITAVRFLERWWNSRYTISDMGVVERSPYALYQTPVSTRVIETADEYIIVLAASFLTLQGALENSAWDTVSWKDAEISYTNLESGRIRDKNVDRLWTELEAYLIPPSKRLARAQKGTLPGFVGNSYERIGEY